MRQFVIHYRLFAFVAALLPFISFSQFSLSGKIADEETDDPLQGAHVLLGTDRYTTYSDNNGNYFFDNLQGGTYSIKVTFIGFKTWESTINVESDKVLNIDMSYSVMTIDDDIIVSATRADEDIPATFSTVDRETINRNNTGQDLPYILQLSPSVVTTSDAGAGIGYTGIRIRGTDISRINVTMNGVPVNDAESHAVYFVDLPDLASSVDNIQIQRGVGTSSNGAAAFGASINIKTTKLNPDPYGEINSMAGSFNSFKNTARFGTGLIGGNWSFDGRVSAIQSDGYVDRSWSDLNSFYLSGGYYSENTIVKAIITSGREKTYQAWYGTPKDSLKTNRTYNPSGEMLDDGGNITGYYDNQTDNYQQDYYQLHLVQKLTEHSNLSSALFYTRGKGYFESYRNDDPFFSYGFDDVIIGPDTIRETDLVRQKWLDNDFYGINLALNLEKEKYDASIGGGWNNYHGDHFGYIVWAEYSSNSFIDIPWYENTGKKQDYHFFARINYKINKRFNVYGDLQFRGIDYSIDGVHDNLRDLTQSHSFSFFNPKGGISFKLTEEQRIYASVAVANREPNRNVYRDADPGQEISHETLIDYEAGYKLNKTRLSLGANFYYMDYRDQLVLTGQINNVGDPILVNVPESYRTGIEITGGWKILSQLAWEFNASISSNKIKNFTSYTDDWDLWPEQKVEQLGTTDISFSPDIVTGSIISWEAFTDFTAALQSNYVGRQYIDNTSSAERSLDPYFVNNLRLSYTIETSVIPRIEFMLSLFNILNEEYETNAWVYRYLYGGEEYELNGYFPQAKFHFMGGVSLGF